MTELDFHPLTPNRWRDFEQLFGPRGACAGCWCMYWKLPRKEFNTRKGDGNLRAQKEIVLKGGIPGLLAYNDRIPTAWCAVEPRANYTVLARSRILAPLDETPVWSIPCFFVDKHYRRQGLTVALLREAIGFVARQGGKVVEGYPTEPREGGKENPVFVYTGLVSAFRQAGFIEAGRRSERRPIMRYYIK